MATPLRTRCLDVIARGPGAAARLVDGAIELTREGARDADADDETVALEITHPFERLAHLWLPHLAPLPESVIGDAVFRAPAIVLADDARAMVLVVDVDDVALGVGAGFRTWLDYDHARRTITLAAGAYEATGHVFYERRPARLESAAVRLRLHVVESAEEADLANPYGLAARWLWERWGRRGLLARAPPPIPKLVDHVLRWAFASGWTESVWQEVTPEAGAPVFIVDVGRHPSVPPEERTWREPRSIWNQAWFSTQRCANGLLRHARHAGDRALEARARAMTRIALAAPQERGLFPAVLLADEASEGGWRWTSSDRRPETVSPEACHVVDAAFTCRMLLEWSELTGDQDALAYVRRFAARLLELQRPSGAFPGWVEPDGSVARELAEGPESAVAASLLFELGMETPARAALSFLADVARDGRWEDFETYYSCAPWGAPEQIGRRIARNGVYKQNTLSIAWCADAFLRGGDLALARRCVDELSLYQAVWDPPFLPAPAHGGFGVMNADSEWNDARQSLFAPLYLELGRRLGDRELTERGVSALRASFSMLYAPENPALVRAYERRFPFFGPESWGFMMENQGHGTSDPIGTFTIFSWGNGSAVAAAATVRDRFPEVVELCGL